MFKEYFFKIQFLYNSLDNRKKRILLVSVIFISILAGLQTFLLDSVDKYNNVNATFNETQQKNSELVTQEKITMLEDANNSPKNLEKQKNTLANEINLLIEKSNGAYLNENDIPKFMKDFFEKTNSIKIVELKSEPIKKEDNEKSILIKHFFTLKLLGSYNNIYHFIQQLDQNKVFNIEKIEFEKKDEILTTIRFFIINKDLTLMKLGETPK